MEDKLALKLEITYFINCPEDQKKIIKEKLDNFGWNLLQDINITNAIKKFPNTIETGYDVKVLEPDCTPEEFVTNVLESGSIDDNLNILKNAGILDSKYKLTKLYLEALNKK
jgi:hypothetical protein